MARVAWSVIATGYQGHGDWVTVELAAAWVKHMNAICPTVHHWIELKKVEN